MKPDMLCFGLCHPAFAISTVGPGTPGLMRLEPGDTRMVRFIAAGEVIRSRMLFLTAVTPAQTHSRFAATVQAGVTHSDKSFLSIKTLASSQWRLPYTLMGKASPLLMRIPKNTLG